MSNPLAFDESLLPLAAAVERALEGVSDAMRQALDTPWPDVAALCRHVERYRGKMLRPRLVLLASAAGGDGELKDASESATKLAAVFETIHLATLVHDDVLDDADVRRDAQTISAMRGVETAVILGDYLIAAAYRLCSSIGDGSLALEVARVCMRTAEGEILQLSHRRDWSVDEPTYEAIVGGKTGELIAASCRLGGRVGGLDDAREAALAAFGWHVGVAFQIQDDLLDLLGDEASVGKSVGKDLEKGKLTLPLLRHLASAEPAARGRVLSLIDVASAGGPGAHDAAGEIVAALRASTAIDESKARALELADLAITELGVLPETSARRMLEAMANAAVQRSR